MSHTQINANETHQPLPPQESGERDSGTGALPRVLPFLVFMMFIGLEEIVSHLRNMGIISFGDAVISAVYPLRVLAAAIALWIYRSSYSELRWKELAEPKQIAATLTVGIAVFCLWIGAASVLGTDGNPRGFNPTLFEDPFVRWALIAARLSGAVLVVPIMEELFWRSFLLRYLVRTDFQQVPIGLFTWSSFVISVLLFGFEHHLIIAGMIAGTAYNMLLYYTRSIAHCTVAHSVTNLLLGVYVLYTGSWYFW
jgi:hypothetical protein